MDCKVCYLPFDEVIRRPRNLACGHSFCTSCLENILKMEGTMICPECRVWRVVENVCELPVSYGVLRVLEAMREASKSGEEEEEEEPRFVLPKLKRDLQHENESKGAATATNEESAMEQLTKIYHCPENMEELQPNDRTMKSVVRACQADLQTLERIMRSRRSLIEYLEGEVERSKREQEAAEVKKRELLACKEQCDGTAMTADMQHVLPNRFIHLRNSFEKLLKVEKETTHQLRKFSSCICRNDKVLVRTLTSEDSLEFICSLFEEIAGRQ